MSGGFISYLQALLVNHSSLSLARHCWALEKAMSSCLQEAEAVTVMQMLRSQQQHRLKVALSSLWFWSITHGSLLWSSWLAMYPGHAQVALTEAGLVTVQLQGGPDLPR